jgi:ParB family chromosome partitioning protein
MTAKRQPAKTTANTRAAAKKATGSHETKTAPSSASTAKADERLMLPLRSLAPSKDNVRRFASEAGISELCANIAALGLLQNLTGRKTAKGKYEIEAGARRLRALKELAKRGAVIEPEGVKVTLDYLVPVLVKGADHNATELSLSENIIRENMHTADEVEAFRKLIEDDGMTPEQVGDRFGKSPMTVRRRVKLAKVSPRIMEAFRAGDVTLQHMEAFALSDDLKAQEATFDGLPEYNRTPEAIRARLANEKIAASNRLAQFVGVEAYSQAGGTITRDLFSEDDEDAVFLDDKPLVVRLATEKLEAVAEETRSHEGWKWFEVYLAEHESRGGYSRLATNEREQTPQEREELLALAAYLDEREAAYDSGDMTEEEVKEFDAKSERQDAIANSCIVFDAEEIPLAGIIVSLNYAGEVSIKRGLYRKEEAHDLAALQRARQAAAREANEAAGLGEGIAEEPGERVGEGVVYSPATTAEIEAEGYSQGVTEDLTILRTKALALRLSQRPNVALHVIIHKLAEAVFYRGGNGKPYDYTAGGSCLLITAQSHEKRQAAPDEDNHAAFTAFDERHVVLASRLPNRYADLWDWLILQDEKSLLDVLAFCVAFQIEASYRDHRGAAIGHADQIALAMNFDMAGHWRVSQGFLSRVSKKTIATAAREAGCSEDAIKAIGAGSKSEAVAIALDAMKDRPWLPPVLRNPLAPVAAAVIEDDEAFEDEAPADDPEGEETGEFADDGHDEAGALASVYGPDDAGELTEAAE